MKGRICLHSSVHPFGLSDCIWRPVVEHPDAVQDPISIGTSTFMPPTTLFTCASTCTPLKTYFYWHSTLCLRRIVPSAHKLLAALSHLHTSYSTFFGPLFLRGVQGRVDTSILTEFEDPMRQSIRLWSCSLIVLNLFALQGPCSPLLTHFHSLVIVTTSLPTTCDSCKGVWVLWRSWVPCGESVPSWHPSCTSFWPL
jgi:hypothetical protein